MPSSPSLPPAVFQAIVEQVPDAIVYADRTGVIRAWNRGAEALFGFAAGEVLGRSLDVMIPERLRPAHWSAFEQAVQRGATRGAGEVRITRAVHRDGRRLYVAMSFGLVTDPAGTVVGAVAVAREHKDVQPR